MNLLKMKLVMYLIQCYLLQMEQIFLLLLIRFFVMVILFYGLQIDQSLQMVLFISWEPSGQTFQPIDVYPNTTTTYTSITDANNCVN